MGKGIDLARSSGSTVHADVLDNMKDQLIIVLMKRLLKTVPYCYRQAVDIPVAETDNTGNDILSFSVNEDKVFHFVLSKKS